MRQTIITFLALSVITSSSWAAPTSPEQRCQKARLDATAKYLGCHDKALGKFYASRNWDGLFSGMSRCRAQYQATWPKLQRVYPSTSCDAPRFVDNGDGTVADNLTNLVWTQTTDDGTVRDKDNVFTWSSDAPWREDGTVFDTLLSSLNNSSFGGSRGWRLPTLAELQTILSGAYPCATVPCMAPIFGPVPIPSNYWSASPDLGSVQSEWVVGFDIGGLGSAGKGGGGYVRAVRGGL